MLREFTCTTKNELKVGDEVNIEGCSCENVLIDEITTTIKLGTFYGLVKEKNGRMILVLRNFNEYDLVAVDDDKKESIGVVILFGLYCVFLACITIGIFAFIGHRIIYTRYGTLDAYLQRNENTCTEPLPMKMQLVDDGDGNYAIQIEHSLYGNEFLWALTDGSITDHFKPLTTFSDSCRAKNFAWQYYRDKVQENRKIKSFK
jgi:hypothetical protein